jgi:hypothetical protein
METALGATRMRLGQTSKKLLDKGRIKCAFCKGTGKDPFDLLSELATCQVCEGTGKVGVVEPAIKCVFCKATVSILTPGLPALSVMAKVWLQLKVQLKSVLNVKTLAFLVPPIGPLTAWTYYGEGFADVKVIHDSFLHFFFSIFPFKFQFLS